MLVTDVEWQSPAWNAGLRKGYAISALNGSKVSLAGFRSVLDQSMKGAILKISFIGKEGERTADIAVAQKQVTHYTISKISNPNALQRAIFNRWISGK